MFEGKHYVPILRGKAAEFEALRYLDSVDRRQILPLVEIVPTRFQPPKNGPRRGIQPRPEDVLAQFSRDVLQCWGNGVFFLDFQHVRNLPSIRGVHPIDLAARDLVRLRAQPILVGHLNDSFETRGALKEVVSRDKKGVCLRVLPSEVQSSSFRRSVDAYLNFLGIERASVDLLLDYQVLADNSPDFETLLSLIQDVRQWRNFIAASGAFPENLSELWPDRHEIPRRDWAFWRDQVLYRRLARVPLFSDYTIQFGSYKEPPENSNPSASIRYTFADTWIVMRGYGLRNKNGPKNEQYPAEAQFDL